MTDLRDKTAALDAAVNAALGDEITYTPDGGAPQTFNAWVEFDSEQLTGLGSRSTAAVRSIEVPKSRVATVSVTGDRITIAILPGETYKPADAREDETGANWRIPLSRVRDA